MYVVQGVTVKLGDDRYYNVLDTEDGVAENIDVNLISKDCLFFGDIYDTFDKWYERSFYNSRSYKMVEKDFVGFRKPDFDLIKPTYKVYDILNPLDGVVVDNSFMLHRESDVSFSISTFNCDTKCLITLKDNEIFINSYKVFKVYDYKRKNIKLGICEIERFANLDFGIIYRLHMIVINDGGTAIYEGGTDELYLDLNAKYGYVYWYCNHESKKVALSKKQEMKLILGGVW